MILRRMAALALMLLLLPLAALAEAVEAEIVPPAFPIREDVARVIAIAQEEIGYAEKGGVTKYGEWSGDPKAEWCAEFLCWTVDQADKQLGVTMLNRLYPNYSANNTGRDWFIREGRYIARKAIVPGWGSQWFKGSSEPMESGSYLPQPGDWVFFSYNSTGDTSHVAMVEHLLRLPDGSHQIQVIEGNNPSAVARAHYPLLDWRIQGYGTVRDLADLVLRMGVEGRKVQELQQKLCDVGLLAPTDVTGFYNQRTSDAVKAFQHSVQMKQNGIANQQTQLLLDDYHRQYRMQSDSVWLVDDAD